MKNKLDSVIQTVHLKNLNINVPWIALGTAEIETGKHYSEKELMGVIHTSLERGIRVVDTASNYYSGKAEECIGKVISGMNLNLRNSGIVVFTKAGQLTYDEMKELTSCANGEQSKYWCFDPDYLEMSIRRSLDRLGLDQLDCVFIHNPEDVLGDVKIVSDVLYNAIPVFEKLCSEEVIKFWGIASWSGFFSSFGNPGCIQLMEIYEHLEREYKQHHFAAIQCPFGKWNTSLLNENSQNVTGGSSEYISVKETAELLSIDLLINSPFCGGAHLPDNSHPKLKFSAAQRELVELHSILPQTLQVLGMRSSESLQEAVNLLETINE